MRRVPERAVSRWCPSAACSLTLLRLSFRMSASPGRGWEPGPFRAARALAGRNELKKQEEEIREVASAFLTEGRFARGERVLEGHINDTYRLYYETGGKTRRYILQRINRNVFCEPRKVMDNIIRVTSFARRKIEEAGGDPSRETLNLVPTRDRGMYVTDSDGETWRLYHCIEGARTYETPESPAQVFSAARTFARFQKMLEGLPGGRLHETIPGFHDTRRRFEALQAAIRSDPLKRAAGVREEIAFALERENGVDRILEGMAAGRIPERVTHNDTKLNNVMFDLRTGEGVCVIDLDTIMPGSALYDFGESVRIGTSLAAEDERDLSRVGFSLPLFEGVAAGYLEAASDFLTEAEVELLPFSARLMAYENGIRFLTDHLNGDVYFRIHRPGQNLDRCRTQFKMALEMERSLPLMEAVVRKYARRK